MTEPSENEVAGLDRTWEQWKPLQPQEWMSESPAGLHVRAGGGVTLGVGRESVCHVPLVPCDPLTLESLQLLDHAGHLLAPGTLNILIPLPATPPPMHILLTPP